MHKVPAIISLGDSSPSFVLPFAPSAPTILLFSTKRWILQPEAQYGHTVITFFNSHSNVLILDTTRG